MTHETPAQRLRALGYDLPPAPQPIGKFRPARQIGSFVYLSGQGPLLPDGTMATGKVGLDVTTDDAAYHAQRAGLVLLSALQDALGDLERVTGIVKLLGMVNCTPEFGEQPEVINGCSTLLAEVFGERGEHARSAIGVAALPRNITVEIEAVVHCG